MALTPWQQMVLDKSRADGGQGTIQEMLQIGGLELNPENFAKAEAILAGAGITAPKTIAENQARLAREAGPGNKPLTPYQQQVYDLAQANEMTSQDIAQSFNTIGYPLQESEVDDLLMGAGLKLPPRKPGGVRGEQPTNPALTPQPPEYNGGNPGRQPDGLGMYGGIQIKYTNTPGTEMPQHPQLRSIWNDMRRRGRANYKGQTDTILTSARGVTGPALLKRLKLSGS